MKEQEIGEIFKEGLAGFEQQPPAGAWEGIRNAAAVKRFNRGRILRRWGMWVGVPVAAVTAVVVAVVLLTRPADTPTAPAPSPVAPTTAVTVAEPATSEATSTPVATSAIAKAEASATSAPATQQKLIPAEATPLAPVAAPPAPVVVPVKREPAPAVLTPLATIPAVPAPKTVQSVPGTKPGVRFNSKDFQQQNDVAAAEPAPEHKEDFRLIYSHDTLVCRNSKVSLYVLNADNVFWSFGSQNPTEELIIEEHTYVRADVRTRDGKDTVITVNIGVYDCELFIPSAFTPNGDGLNDEWMVYAPAGITDFECTVYNKAGQVLFHTNNIHQGWDGRENGKYLPAAGYFYDCRFRDEMGYKHTQKGQVTLVR